MLRTTSVHYARLKDRRCVTRVGAAILLRALTTCTSHRYEFFEKGTKIDVIKENYEAIDFNAAKIQKGTKDQEQVVAKLCKEAEDAEREFQEAMKLLR